jgi:dihydroorotate dehydrogenase electron transfer subunit
VKELARNKERLDRSIKGVVGATSSDKLLFADEFGAYADELVICTDDGTRGRHGQVTEFLDALGADADTDVYVCGPEKMMKAVAEQMTEEGVNPDRIQLLIERRMDCAEGLCGKCDCGGLRVCDEGPVSTCSELKENAHFGKVKRRKSGLLEPI